LDTKYFGTDGIRGIAGQFPVDGVFAQRLGIALVRYLRQKKSGNLLLLGRDTRTSGPMLIKGLVGGITCESGDCLDAGVITTPGLGFLTKELGFDMGVMISASHNPYMYNGFKVFKSEGIKLTKEEELELEEFIEDVKESSFQGAKGAKTLVDGAEKYEYFLKSTLRWPDTLNQFSVALDCANGSTSHIAPKLFSELCRKTHFIFASPDGENINKECGSEHPHGLAQIVRKGTFDMGFCFDGDGDRVIVIDEKGQILSGEHLLYVLSKYLLLTESLTVPKLVTTIMSNSGLKVGLKRLGMEIVETDVGDRNVCYRMMEVGAKIGGEESGHIILFDHLKTGDGMLTALKFLEAVSYFGKHVSELSQELEIFPKKMCNLKVPKKLPLSQIPQLLPTIGKNQSRLGDLGKIIVRYSGTEPLIRIMVEAQDVNLLDEIMDEIVEILKPYTLP